jgi:hypothetical protein
MYYPNQKSSDVQTIQSLQIQRSLDAAKPGEFPFVIAKNIIQEPKEQRCPENTSLFFCARMRNRDYSI